MKIYLLLIYHVINVFGIISNTKSSMIHRQFFVIRLTIDSFVQDILPYSGLLWRGKSGSFGLSPPYFSRSIILPAIIKPADSAFWVSGAYGSRHLARCFKLVQCSINILNYLFEQYMPNHKTVQQKARFLRKSETKVSFCYL